jgi:uncharacterized protein (TIGR03083 family)
MSPTAPSAEVLISTLRGSHDRLRSVLTALNADELASPSYDTEWSIADVASHLGSGAEIFALMLAAARAGEPTPGIEAFHPIWDVWNARGPVEKRDLALSTDDAFIRQLEAFTAEEAESFRIALFGMDLDLAGITRMRLSEHAVHTWDVAVAVDPTATVSPDAVDLLIDGLGQTAGYSSKPSPEEFRVRIDTTDPQRAVLVSAGEKASLEPVDAASGADVDGTLTLPAEAYLRLIYGRLDPDHTPAVTETGTRGLADLRSVFKGL